jgi:thioredoxin domain-containing protein 5
MQLTPDNFKSSIEHGVWWVKTLPFITVSQQVTRFVEHFSPYCHHCRDFAGTWIQLTEDIKNTPNSGIQLAQVNCVVYGDLCNENKITGFPQLNLYRNGEFVNTFEGARDYNVLVEYVNKYAEPTSTTKSPPPATSPPPTQTPTTTKQVEVLHVQTPRADINPLGSVLELGPHNFQNFIDQGPVFVKYFAPW